jgi:hypothetical protein
VKEESHLEEMRAALRGERERADQAKQRSLENVRALVEPSAASRAEPPPPAPPEPRRGLFGRFRKA